MIVGEKRFTGVAEGSPDHGKRSERERDTERVTAACRGLHKKKKKFPQPLTGKRKGLATMSL